jgi:2-polyprenyl-3-methyl-5-hydroxy-6-metoxy-1,4-benzoquinol methylase
LGTRQHWDEIYSSEAPQEVSWFCPHLETSLALIERAASERDAAILDVGGGASMLVDDLLDHGYRNVTVLDISQSALQAAQKRLGERSRLAQWVCADVMKASLPMRAYKVWHDRAVFHFLTQAEQRRDYVSTVTSAVEAAGHVIVSTFGPEGPTRCSGFDVVRYDSDSLQAEFGPRFRLVESVTELHRTPVGTTQQLLYCHSIFES